MDEEQDRARTDEEGEVLKRISIDRVHEALVVEESREHDMDEIIPLGRISDDDVEFKALTESDVDPERVLSGEVSRAELLAAGFVFNNYPIGPLMEKPLIKGAVDGVDYSNRKLLTGEELQRVIEFQRNNPADYIPEDVEVDDLRRDMLHFMLGAGDPRPVGYDDPVNVLRMARSWIAKPKLYSAARMHEWEQSPRAKTAELDQRLVDMYWESVVRNEAEKSGIPIGEYNPHDMEIEFVAQNCQDIFPWEERNRAWAYEARGKQVSMIEGRKTKLNGLPSPFLDSGFHFPPTLEVAGQVVPIGNPDCAVYTDKKIFRVNMMVYHLLSRGLSEMGDSEGRSNDQDYTVGHYVRELYATPENDAIHAEEDSKMNASLNFNPDTLVLKMSSRMIELARKWAEGEESPKSAKRVLQRIRRKNKEPIWKRIRRK